MTLVPTLCYTIHNTRLKSGSPARSPCASVSGYRILMTTRDIELGCGVCLTMSEHSPQNLSVTSLSQYIRFDNCERFLRLRLCPDEAEALLDKWGLHIQPLTPLLKEAGLEFERSVEQQLAARGEQVISLRDTRDVEPTLDWMQRVRQPVILLQPWLEAPLGRCTVHGQADVVRLARDRKGALRISVADIKASRHERMEHRLQVATYAYLLTSMATDVGLPVAEVTGSVLCLQEDGSLPGLDLEQPSFDLNTYITILHHMVTDGDSVVKRVLELPFDQVFYHLSYRCDGCMYNALCFLDSAERLDISLTPYLSAVEKRSLLSAGITSLPQLAGLMTLPGEGDSARELRAAPGQERLVASLTSQWPVGPNLSTIVQRARRVLHRFDPTVESRSFLVGAGYGSLPSEEDHPNLVKVFFDAQRDYLIDRVYMISALVVGPNGERPVVHLSNRLPDLDTEAALLAAWVRDVLLAIGQVAGADAAPIHLYCYNAYDQRVLLEALKRHLHLVATIPAFYDLLTQTPALGQSIISFLHDELRQRRNLGQVCTPLHEAARLLGFDWYDGQYELFRLFRARLFDNRRDAVRQADGSLKLVRRDTSADISGRLTIEAAARFNSQIPLEYAYAAWGRLPESAQDRELLQPFRAVTLDHLRAFAVHRVRALQHIERSFKLKARGLVKPPIRLASFKPEATNVNNQPLAQVLKEFLLIEQHASLQSKLLVYAQPIEQRALTGTALLLRCVACEDEVCRFVPAFQEVGLDPVLAMHACRFKEGDWVVLNANEPHMTAHQIKCGRLAIIERISSDEVTLRLLNLAFANGKFRFFHDTSLLPEAGQLYTIDEMADDLNADKQLAALSNTGSNVLCKWLVHPPPPQPVDARADAFLRRFAAVVSTIEGRRKPTARQLEVIAGHLAEPLFLVQGPPGTGKSHTLAWGVLSRVATAFDLDQPCRVAVSCKTHNAVNVVLGALMAKLRTLTGFVTAETRALQNLTVFKLVNDLDDVVPDGVVALSCHESSYGQLRKHLESRFLVVGGTPGGFYNLMRYRTPVKQIDWTYQPFDLVVIDEASQMSLPEAVLACAFLKSDGRLIVVGDHRQMPPIVSHAWQDEPMRSMDCVRPYLSLFECLMERGFPRVALDESFRLHPVIARFLRDNVYVRDGINFFSRRNELLDPSPVRDEYVARALDPNYPIVVIEHGETGSQQFNQTEVELAAPLIDICANSLRLDGRDGIGVVVPHRAQKALLRQRFPELAVSESIDTVERFQGGERDVIIVCATASDPDYVLAEADFLLNLNRLNVALSRPRKKLIVIASRSVVRLLVSDLQVFDNAIIWKRLYYQYASHLLWQGERHGVPVWLRGKRTEPLS